MLNNDAILQAIGTAQRLLGDLPTKAEVQQMRRELEDAYDDLTARYMEEHERLLRLEVIAPTEAVSVSKSTYKVRKRGKTKLQTRGLPFRIFTYLSGSGAKSVKDISFALQADRSLVSKALGNREGIFFRSTSYGVWEAIPEEGGSDESVAIGVEPVGSGV
jgi:hypothetical protein